MMFASEEYAGDTCASISGRVDSDTGWYVGFRTDNLGEPTTAWTWVTGAVGASGSGNDLFRFSPGLTLGDYFYLIITVDYGDPTPSPPPESWFVAHYANLVPSISFSVT